MNGGRLAMLSAILIGVSTVFSNLASKNTSPLLVSTYALLISAALLFIIIFCTKNKIPSIYEISRSADFWKITISRNIAGAVLLQYGLSMTSVISSVVMLRLEPVFVMAFGHLLLKEKMKTREILYVLAMIVGAILMSTAGNLSLGTAQIGDLLIALAVVFMGYSYIPVRRITQNSDPVQITAFSNFAGGLVLLVASVIILPSLVMSDKAFGFTMASVILFYVIGLTLWFKSLKTTKAWIVASLLSLSPIAGGLIAFVWLGESINFIQLVGATIILVVSYKISTEHKD
ncbi:MAG: DMT family transporter [Candidatus Aenigmatarchaeota archaeon]